ncbi:E3 ubiquitin-protein ligase RNF13 [Turdus rufiventris]|nr:E3 ubiquitin-protein ligase RNF13 [Turdus rufiventris]
MLLSIGMLMLSATQIYTIVTVQLFAFLNLLPVEADILAYNLENGTQTFDDLPARFGYRLPAEGLKGFLINSKPENACEPIAPPPLRDNSSGAFIVLIRRLECNFDVKVLNAQRAGYKAAIVHNVDSDDLISMGSNDIEILKKIDIPSVFIGETSANSLKEEFTYEKGVQSSFGVLLNPFPDNSRDLSYSHRHIYGDEYDVCAICLDEYEDGDKLRILPCSHAYHCKCVDPWLTKTKKTCPVCKQKVVPSQGDSDSETDSSQEENEVSENTPLLRPLASVSTQSFGALSESHSHQNMTESSEYEEDDNDNVDSSDAENGMNEESVVVQLQPSEDREYRVANTV